MTLTIPDGAEVVLHAQGNCAGFRMPDGVVYTHNMTLTATQARAFKPAELDLLPPRAQRYLETALRRMLRVGLHDLTQAEPRPRN